MTSTKDRDSARVALENIFRGLPLQDQCALIEEWLWGAFDWQETPQRHDYWRDVARGLKDLSRQEQIASAA